MGKSFQLQLLPIFCVLSIAVLFTTIGCNGSQEKLDDNPGQEQTIATADSLVYRITIDDEINPSVSRLVRRGIEEAKKREADYLFIELETYGGLVVDADDIRTDLLNCPIPVIIYIQNNAASAGALISLACDSIYMNPSATIGAAAVVDQTGEVQAEKYQSYMRGKMRATAEANGRNPAIAEGMVDPTIVVPGISDSSKIITLTAQEATSEAINFCEGIAPDADSALRLAGLGEYTVQNHVPTSTDNVIGFFVRPVVSSLLLALIVIGIVLEFKTPGVGLFIMISLVAAVLYFLPLYYEGLAANWEIALFLLGLVLLAIEVFVIPGFGVFGIIGFTLVACGLGLAMVQNLDKESYEFTLKTSPSTIIRPFLLVASVVILGFISAIFLLGKGIQTSYLSKRLTVESVQSKEEGYVVGRAHELNKLKGKEGHAISMLRPMGKVKIDGKSYHARCEQGYLDSGTPIRVDSINGATLLVSKSTDD
ncbi:MAG: NfeD family protein [Chitinophagales bacterium]